MLRLQSASLRPSLLALAIVSTLPGAAYATTDDITVTATGNARSTFEAPMMVSVIDTSDPRKPDRQLGSRSAASCSRDHPERKRANQRPGYQYAWL